MVKKYEKVRKELLFKFLKKEDNIFHAQKIFIAISVLNWIMDQKPDHNLYEKYMGYIGKFLYDEINLYWENGVIKYKISKEKHDS